MPNKPVSKREQLESLFRDQTTDMFKPIRERDLRGLKKALSKGGLVSDTDADGSTPLFVATFIDPINHEAIEHLLAAGAKADVPNQHGTTPLMVAAIKQDLPAMRMLTAAGASPLARDEKGLSALDHIHSGSNPLSGKPNHSRLSAIALLAGAVAKSKDNPDIEIFGLMPMHWAALANDDEMINRLLQMGADPFKPAKNGKTVFECAVRNKKAWQTMLSELAIQFRTEFEQMRAKKALTASNLIKFFEARNMRSPEGYTHWTLSEVKPVLDYLLNPPKEEKLVPDMNLRQIGRMEKFAMPTTTTPSLAAAVAERANREMNLQMAIDAAVLLVAGLPMDAVLLGLKRKRLRSPFDMGWTEEALERLLHDFGLYSRKAGAEFSEKGGGVIIGMIADSLHGQGIPEEQIAKELIVSQLFAPAHAEVLMRWLRDRFE